MEKTKKVIILDLDETLEHGIYQSRYDVGNQMTMVLRPNLDILLKKFEMLKGKLQKDVTFLQDLAFTVVIYKEIFRSKLFKNERKNKRNYKGKL